MDPLRSNYKYTFENTDGTSKVIDFNNPGKDDYDDKTGHFDKVLHSNLLFDRKTVNHYDKFNRYGWLNPYDQDYITREYLFFTKPDLCIFNNSNYKSAQLIGSLAKSPFFIDAAKRHKRALAQLQYGVKDEVTNSYNPFMTILSNMVTSKLDLQNISSESIQSTPNTYGVALDYRSHSFKSDYQFDFSLSFTDTAYLDLYTMVKAYDEYMRKLKLGEISVSDAPSQYKQYITDMIIPEQFSVYKFLVGSDGETIIYYAKATGVYFTDVPRAEFSDPGNDGFKYSLNFHANFVEDMNPFIIKEFNTISPGDAYSDNFYPVYDMDTGLINNEFARYPTIISISDSRSDRRNVPIDYRLKWTDDAKSINNKSNNTDLLEKIYNYFMKNS